MHWNLKRAVRKSIYLCEEIMDSQNCEHLNYTDSERMDKSTQVDNHPIVLCLHYLRSVSVVFLHGETPAGICGYSIHSADTL